MHERRLGWSGCDGATRPRVSSSYTALTRHSPGGTWCAGDAGGGRPMGAGSPVVRCEWWQRGTQLDPPKRSSAHKGGGAAQRGKQNKRHGGAGGAPPHRVERVAGPLAGEAVEAARGDREVRVWGWGGGDAALLSPRRAWAKGPAGGELSTPSAPHPRTRDPHHPTAPRPPPPPPAPGRRSLAAD